MKRTCYLLCASVLLTIIVTGCEKVIDMDYRTVEPQVVIEGCVTNETVSVLITATRNMEDSVKVCGKDGATVILSDGKGFSEQLLYEADGHYRSPSQLKGTPGTAYTLTVETDGKTYTSSSVMQRQAVILSTAFRWEKFMNSRMLYYEVEVEDIKGEENYYCYRMYRNGEPYRWNVFTDKGDADGIILVDITCMDEDTAEDNKEEDRDDILYDGDRITMEVQTIDRRAYDYLYSLGLSERTSANPIADFAGGCLGYFSAYSAVRVEDVFE